MDGGANNSITNNLDDFEAFWKIKPVPLQGVASNVTVLCTRQGMCNLITRNCNVMHMIMFYSSQASHVMMSPNDVVSPRNYFSAWTQHSDMKSGTGHDRFSSQAVSHSEHVDLKMNNDLRFLGTPRCNMKDMSSSTSEIVNSLTLDLQHKL